jgi:hypothetical protein
MWNAPIRSASIWQKLLPGVLDRVRDGARLVVMKGSVLNGTRACSH